jgi:subtilisin-like proprotein convertase family protein
VRDWGEQAQGQWKVNIADRAGGFSGTLQGLRLELLGSDPLARLNLTFTKAKPCLTLTSAAPGWRYKLEISTNLFDCSSVAIMEIDSAGACLFGGLPQPSTECYRAELAH